MDEQCNSELEIGRERTVGGGDTKPGCVGATCQKHRPHIGDGKYAVEEERKKVLTINDSCVGLARRH